jgi:hypothetical protein
MLKEISVASKIYKFLVAYYTISLVSRGGLPIVNWQKGTIMLLVNVGVVGPALHAINHFSQN